MKQAFRSLLFLLTVGMVFYASTTPQAASYRLPLAPDAASRLLQGYEGPYGHKEKLAFAYDFRLPIGSPVRAARAGKVIALESSFTDSTRRPGEENYIFIDHGDKTFGRYYHLTKNGVLVRLGDRVTAGQVIGKSGDSGASAGPHLHFDVTSGCPEWGCQTIPIEFADSLENPLVVGKVYSGSK